jgi:hypothetical protein
MSVDEEEKGRLRYKKIPTEDTVSLFEGGGVLS